MSGAQEPITTLADYITALHQMAAPNSGPRFIYRGQKDERWHIDSGALRRLQKEPLKYPELLPSLFRGYLHRLIDEVQLRYASAYHNLTALECMAHLQHNRVATGLIDFTYNPLVALWFACEPDGATAGKVFVVTIDPAQIREITTKSALDQDLKIFFEEDGQWHLWQPSIDNSAIDTHRMTMQQSVFLFGLPAVAQSMIAREILIPQAHKETFRRELETLGISEKTLFSDLAGFLERNTAQSPYNRDLAEDYYTEEIRKAHGHEFSENYFQRANFRVALGKYKDALADYDRAIELNPDYAAAYYNRGNAKQKLGRDEAAVGDFDEAIRLNPDYAEAYGNRGTAKATLGRHEAAVADYNEVIRLNPDYAIAYNNRGNVKQELGQHEVAVTDFDEAIRLNPDYAAAYVNRGNAKAVLDQREAARQDFTKARDLAGEADNDSLVALAEQGLQALANRGDA